MSHKNLDLAACCVCHETKDCRPFGEGRAGICYDCAMRPENRQTVAVNMLKLAATNSPRLRKMLEGVPDEAITVMALNISHEAEQLVEIMAGSSGLVPGPRMTQ